MAEPTKLVAGSDCSSLTFGVYNVENLQPSSSHLPRVADHIVNYLNSPTLMFLQEVQDNNGPTNDNSMHPLTAEGTLNFHEADIWQRWTQTRPWPGS